MNCYLAASVRSLSVIWISSIVLLVSVSSYGQFNLAELPLHAMPAAQSGSPMIVYISGDGGWNKFNERICDELNKQNYPIIALDSKKYFWSEKTPQTFANDLQSIINHYLKLWNKRVFVLAGYSFGADAAAMLPSLLKNSLKQSLRSVVLISPSSSTDLEIHVADLVLASDDADRKYKLTQALRDIDAKTICIFGREEESLLKDQFPKIDSVAIKVIPGNHHFENHFQELINVVMKSMED